jgi:hypothetical protein
MRFAIGATYALAAAVVRADDASAAEAESSTSTTVAKPTFTVRRLRIAQACSKLTVFVGHKTQGALPRAVHRRLGGPMEAFARKKGCQGRRRGVGIRRHLVCRGAICAEGHGG